MSKFSGKLGFVTTVETEEGVYLEERKEVPTKGFLRRIFNRYNNSDSVNTNLRLSNEVSVIATPWMNNNLMDLRYVVWKGSKWEVQSVSVEPPRVTIQLGGLYAHV